MSEFEQRRQELNVDEGGKDLEVPQQQKAVVGLTKDDTDEEKMKSFGKEQEEKSLQIEEQEGLKKEEVPRIVDEESNKKKRCCSGQDETKQLAKYKIVEEMLNQEEMDLELAVSLQEQEQERRRAWVVALASWGETTPKVISLPHLLAPQGALVGLDF